jgi:ketosteroid isomerase-like protein
VDERSARVLQAVTATVSGDTSSVSELFTEDVFAASPTSTVSSRVELAVEIEDHEDDVTEVVVDLETTVTAGDRTCAEWVASTTHIGATGVPGGRTGPAGRRVTLHGVTVAEFQGERIRSMRHYWHEADTGSEPD